MTDPIQHVRVSPDTPGLTLRADVPPRGAFQVAYCWKNPVAGHSAVGGLSSAKLGYADGQAQVGELNRQFPEIEHWLIPALRSDVVTIASLRAPLHHLN